MKITRSQKSLIRKSTCHKFNVKRFGLTEMSVSKDFRFFQSTRWLLRSPSLQIVSLKRFFIPSFNLIVFILLLFQLIWIFQQFKSLLTYLKKFNEKKCLFEHSSGILLGSKLESNGNKNTFYFSAFFRSSWKVSMALGFPDSY